MLLDNFGLLMRLAFVALFLVLWVILVAILNHNKKGQPQQVSFIKIGTPLIAYVALLIVDTLITKRPYELAASLFAILVVAFVYLTLLILCRKWLRSHCSATTCAGLWALISVLYIFCADAVMGFGLTSAPLVMIPAPRSVVAIVGIIWAVGFVIYVVVAFWKHFKFCAQINESAQAVAEGDPRNVLFQEIKKEFKLAKKTGLMVSDRVVSPVTVGVSKLKLYLPDQEYTDEELTLIYRHELTHVDNQDNQTKVMLMFFRAAYWFIPQMNKVCNQTAEDIELSCDEMVMAGHDEATRLEYAKLILQSPSDSRGFSTCLSASGESLKYRLTQVIHPRENKIIVDFCVVAVALLFMFMTVGLVQISSTYGTVADVLGFNDKNVEIIVDNNEYATPVTQEKVQKFLSETTAYKMGYDLDVPMEGTSFQLQDGKMNYSVSYDGHMMEVCSYHEDYYDFEDTYYYIK